MFLRREKQLITKKFPTHSTTICPINWNNLNSSGTSYPPLSSLHYINDLSKQPQGSLIWRFSKDTRALLSINIKAYSTRDNFNDYARFRVLESEGIQMEQTDFFSSLSRKASATYLALIPTSETDLKNINHWLAASISTISTRFLDREIVQGTANTKTK